MGPDLVIQTKLGLICVESVVRPWELSIRSWSALQAACQRFLAQIPRLEGFLVKAGKGNTLLHICVFSFGKTEMN